MDVKRIQAPILGLVLLASFSACGGNGDTSTPPSVPTPLASAEGHWVGTTTTTTTNRIVRGVVLDDGAYWFLYSADRNPLFIEGVVQGNGNFQNGVLTSSNAKNFNVERPVTPVLDATINGSYTTKQSLNGIFFDQSNVQDTFTTTYDSDYELPPDMNAIAGAYTGPVALNEIVDVTVSAAGEISGTSRTTPTCTFTGSVSPRAHGNVFDVTIIFGGQTTCSNGSDTVRGIGFFDAGTKKLYSAAFNGTKTNGFVFLGTKQ
jgi:hypothetical protein